MVRALQAARRAVRQAQESLYEGLCTIVEYQNVTDEKTKLTRQQEVVVAGGVPCRLSFETITAAAQTETAAMISQGVKLFLAPEVFVKSGSKLIVTQNGKTDAYSASSPPAVYTTHQEIRLTLFRGWS